ncbi:MAG TPA: hypothetical protein VEY91_07795 [Candidatus Limnocylindria bacterium]|nr:hypothetical protein [Candidatus Limnocylindria bacterium]
MRFTPVAWIAMALMLAVLTPAAAQTTHDHGQHPPPKPAKPSQPKPATQAKTAKPKPASAPTLHDHESMAHGDMGDRGQHAMPAFFGPYRMSREASGTSWQPDATPHQGLHAARGPWFLMLHGFADVISNHQGGRRGDDEIVGTNMLMGMASRAAGPGRIGLRTMLSAEPWTTKGKRGYALLLQTGETANGRDHLIDRQHPHDLFMELAASYSVSFGANSVFLYGGLPGEPALGPPAFMHRFSGVALPESPIAHHWLDSTHITFGVLTAGVVREALKFEASGFRGREPDQDRADIETGRLDSHAFRFSWNPKFEWSLQASYGRLDSPEQLSPETDVDRVTVSGAYHAGGAARPWQTLVAYGRNQLRPGPTLDAWLAESALSWNGRNLAFARVEAVEKNELFPEGDPRAEEIFQVTKVGGGYLRDVIARGPITAGIGTSVNISFVPEALESEYGGRPVSGMIFLRGVLR